MSALKSSGVCVCVCAMYVCRLNGVCDVCIQIKRCVCVLLSIQLRRCVCTCVILATTVVGKLTLLAKLASKGDFDSVNVKEVLTLPYGKYKTQIADLRRVQTLRNMCAHTHTHQHTHLDLPACLAGTHFHQLKACRVHHTSHNHLPPPHTHTHTSAQHTHLNLPA